MRKLFISENEFKMKVNPPRKSEYLEVLHSPGTLLSPTTKFLKLPDDYERTPFDSESPINCNLILTDENHDGLYLLVDEEASTIKLPGGVLREEQLDTIRRNEPVTAIFEVIVEEFGRLDPEVLVLNEPFYESPGFNNKYFDDVSSILTYIMKGYGWVDYMIHGIVLYNFYMSSIPKEDDVVIPNEVNLFTIISIKDYKGNIPALTEYRNNNLLWYSRRDHQYNMNNKAGWDIFDSKYKDDIRTSYAGKILLDKILKTERLFGKSNIY
jgi:hypothetical protein